MGFEATAGMGLDVGREYIRVVGRAVCWWEVGGEVETARLKGMISSRGVDDHLAAREAWGIDACLDALPGKRPPAPPWKVFCTEYVVRYRAARAAQC